MSDSTASQAARDVLAERQRQISEEGRSPERDDNHHKGEMALAAAVYAATSATTNGFVKYEVQGFSPIHGDDGPLEYKRFQLVNLWPWSTIWWKPKDRRRDLVRAGALIIAEIERLDRAAAKDAPPC